MANSRLSNSTLASAFTLTKVNSFWLLISQLANTLLLFVELSTWLLAFVLISFIWQCSIYYQLIKQPNRIVKLLIAVAGLILLMISARQLGLLNTMVHLLVFAYLLKPLELNSLKDFYLQVLLGFFVLVTALVFQQSLYFMLLALAIAALNLTLLLSIYLKHSHYQQQYAHSMMLLIKSIPLAVMLFLVFPKIAPLWQMPTARNAATGLSEEVQVGDIAQLALSNELAFRVEFAQKVPQYQQLYWRTLVLDRFDGRKWFRQESNVVKTSSPILVGLPAVANQQAINYQVFAEPSYQSWLFSLNRITSFSSNKNNISQQNDFTLVSDKKLNSVLSYHVSSLLTSRIDIELTSQSRRINTFLPENDNNQQLVAEGQRLRARYVNAIDIVNAVLQRFNRENYHYTLKPPLLNNNNLAQFYFQTMSGFCEHYAGSFTYLMRAAGIPARMVIGYMGGEFNQQGNYFSVYQRDAHAWSEVWIAGQGWLRIDPTASVSPERVAQGFTSLLQQEQADLSNELFTFNAFNTALWFNYLRFTLDAIDYQWTKWVVGYSMADQYQLFHQVAQQLNRYQYHLWVLLMLLLSFAVLSWWYFTFRKKSHSPAGIKEMLDLIDALKVKGLEKTPNMTALQLQQLVVAKYPELQANMLEFISLFEHIHYHALSDQQKFTKLKLLKSKGVELVKQVKKQK